MFEEYRKKHIQKWNWMADNPDKSLKDYRELVDNTDSHFSSACEYDELFPHDESCSNCPIRKNFKSTILCCGGLPNVWANAIDLETKSQMARLLANLKWINTEN